MTNRKIILRLIADVLILFVGLWLGCTIVHAVVDSSIPTGLMDGMFRLSDKIGGALCWVFGL